MTSSKVATATDTADFSDQDVGVTVNLGPNGNGSATRETGFSVRVENAIVDAPAQFGSAIENGAQFVEQAVAGNLYYNIHTSDFPGGEIRGQFAVVSDVQDSHNARVITLAAELDAAQEPGPLSDSDATGTASLTILYNPETGSVSYSSELSVVGLNEADLQTPIPDVVSAIHLHNATAGANGPVVQDTLVDAGATVDGTVAAGVSGVDVIEAVVETDVLSSIENVIGSNDGDVITGSNQSNSLNGADGDDVLNGGAGDDLLTGGEDADIFAFEGLFGNDTVTDFESGVDRLDFSDFGPDFGNDLVVSQDGEDALLTLSSDASVRLLGVNSEDLTDDDFIA